jgi:uncharacterized membrane protein (DUF4010 family)
MYFRLAVVIALFNLELARALALPLAALFLLGLLAALLCRFLTPTGAAVDTVSRAAAPGNPLELSAALLFAVVFVVVSLATSWARTRLGHDGVLFLAAIVGVTDIDPFVLSLAQGGGEGLRIVDLTAAVLVATSSNNLLKAAYSLGFGGWRVNYGPAIALVVLAACGVAAAIFAG